MAAVPLAERANATAHRIGVAEPIMTKRDVAELACRILALYYLVTNLHWFVSIPFLSAGLREAQRGGSFAETGTVLLGAALGILFVLGVVWFLWTRSGWIAEKIVPNEANDSRWPHFRVADLQVVAFSMIGLMTLIDGVRYFSRSAGLYLSYLYDSNHPAAYVSLRDWLLMEQTLPSLLSIVLGLWLILGSRGVVRLIRRLQRPIPGNGDERPETPQAVAAKGAALDDGAETGAA
jgi:hypothetical protein